MIDINGEWIGFYNYVEGYSVTNQLQSVPFIMIIDKGIDEFIGKIIEDVANGGIDDEIIVRGKFNNDVIDFIKFYKNAHYMDENNVQESFVSDTCPEVYYSGQFCHSENKFKGEWKIQDYIFDEEGILQDNIFSGFWEMWKK